jgi:S-adenosylmethionine hydrolase
MPAPILTLITDFGLSDHYVGSMKGVILGICPRARIVDISHEVSPYAIAEGAFLIAQAYGSFPRGTVHVVVVDPGVGSARRPILAKAAGQYFIAPDNGVLGIIFAREKHKVRVISNERYFRHPVSRTFHGRDIFAPVAAHLANGVAPAKIGPVIGDYARPDFEKAGVVLKVDRFGNVITSFRVAAAAQLIIGQTKVTRLVNNYTEARPGELVIIVGSSGYLEVSINQGSAAKKIGCRCGDACQIRV